MKTLTNFVLLLAAVAPVASKPIASKPIASKNAVKAEYSESEDYTRLSVVVPIEVQKPSTHGLKYKQTIQYSAALLVSGKLKNGKVPDDKTPTEAQIEITRIIEQAPSYQDAEQQLKWEGARTIVIAYRTPFQDKEAHRKRIEIFGYYKKDSGEMASGAWAHESIAGETNASNLVKLAEAKDVVISLETENKRFGEWSAPAKDAKPLADLRNTLTLPAFLMN